MSALEELDLKRIQVLTVATFAVAMTLLIFEIKTPLWLSSKEFQTYFFQHLLSDLFIYIIGFITLGIFWIGSHYHHNILLKTDRISSWLNIAFLMITCTISLCISFIRNYKEQKLSLIFYCVILIIASCINLVMISYVWKKKHTKEYYTVSHFNNARLIILIPVFICTASIFICLLSQKISLWISLLPLLLHIFPENAVNQLINRSTK